MYVTEAELTEAGVTATPLNLRDAETNIEAYTGQRFNTWTETVSVSVDMETGEARLPYRVLNVLSVADQDGDLATTDEYTWTSSQIRGQSDMVRMRTLVANDDGYNILIKGLEPWAPARPVYTRSPKITVEGEWGWATPPQDVKTAMLALLAKPSTGTENVTNVKAMSIKGLSVTFGDAGLTDTTGDAFIDRLLLPYRVNLPATGIQVW